MSCKPSGQARRPRWPVTSAGLQPAATRAGRRRGAEGRRGERENCCCCLLLTFPGARLAPPSRHSAVCIRLLVSHFLLNSSLCANLGSNVHAPRCGKPLWNQLCQLAQANKKPQKLYRQFNWSVGCSEIRADTNTWFHLKDKDDRHLLLIIVINPVKQSWRSSSVCLYKYDFCKCNLKHCARIWMKPWLWYDRGRSWLRTGHDPGQDRRLGPKIQNLNSS